MTNQTTETVSRETDMARLTPESLLNLLVKAIGLYWFINGILTCIETIYAWYLGRVNDMTVAVDSQTYTAVWGVAMLAVGAWLIAYSKWITRIAYSFDAASDVSDEELEQVGPPKSSTVVE